MRCVSSSAVPHIQILTVTPIQKVKAIHRAFLGISTAYDGLRRDLEYLFPWFLQADSAAGKAIFYKIPVGRQSG